MANGEFKAVDKGFNGYLDIRVKDTWNYLSKVHGFLFFDVETFHMKIIYSF